MNNWLGDLRYALRTFAKSPAFTLVVVFTLALGIGANAAIFSLMDQVLLRLLPVAQPQRLVVVDAPGPFSGATRNHSETLTPLSHPMFEGLRDRNSVFEGVLAHHPASIHLTVDGQTEMVSGDVVSGAYFEVLGLAPAVGRLLTAQDDRTPGAHPVVVLGHGFWSRRFGADPNIVGSRLSVNGHPMTVVGVAPRGFHGVEVGESIDLYLPLMMQAQALPTWAKGIGDWRTRWLTTMARLKADVSLEQAAAGVNVLYRQLLEEDFQHTEGKSERFKESFLQKKLALLPGGRGTSGLRDQSKTPLVVLMGMVGLVLLIACANVANLLLARSSSRQREIAVRLALGASRTRLVRQLLVESVTLSLMGGALAILVASWCAGLLIRALPFEAAPRVLSAEPDLRLALLAFGLALLTGLVFGIVPALQSTRAELAPVLKNEAGSVLGASSGFRLRKGLVVAQVALSLLLLIGCGLFTRSLMNLRSLDPGFEPERLLAFSVDPSLNGYDPVRRIALLERVRDDLAAEPGVQSASLAQVALMTNSNWSSTVMVDGYEPKEDENMNPNVNGVGSEFFETLGMTLLAGRGFDAGDVAGAPKVAVVNEAFARYFFGDGDPLGRKFGFARDKAKDITIVGLVKDGKSGSLREPSARFLYVPYRQNQDLGEMAYYVRSTIEPSTLGPRLREIVRNVDPALPVIDLKTMRAQIRESLFVERMVAALSGAFGLLATLLAAVGLYGVMSHAVARRTREIGIRMALGAQGRTVLWMVLKEVGWLAAVGVLIGLPSGYGLGTLVESQLFGLSARDPLTFTLATSALLLSALLAGYLPARRATRVDPMVALRYE
jgi:predicted permease